MWILVLKQSTVQCGWVGLYCTSYLLFMYISSTLISLILCTCKSLTIVSPTNPHIQIYRLMKMDCYPRFKRSELVKDCLLAEVEGRTLPIETAPERRPQQPQYGAGIWKKQKVGVTTHPP